MPDEPKQNKKSLAIVVIVLLLLGGGVGAWLFVKARQGNKPPVAMLRLDSLDETNRVATLSDDGSHDPDGTLQSWRIAWGDGNEDNLSAVPRKATHTYASEGQYTISLWCVDNGGATNSSPATVNVTFDLLERQKALEQAAAIRRDAERLKEQQAKEEAERLAQQKQKELDEARKAKEEQELAERRKAQAELARQSAPEPAKTATPLPPTPSAAALPYDPSTGKVIFTPSGYRLGQFQIAKEKTDGMQKDGRLPVVLAIRCVNFPDTPTPISNWQIDGTDVPFQAGRIRLLFAPGQHEVMALVPGDSASKATELNASVIVRTNGECTVLPGKTSSRGS